MVNHAEASRINIERMKQIYQQLSCYRGLGKDAARGSGSRFSQTSLIIDLKPDQPGSPEMTPHFSERLLNKSEQAQNKPSRCK